MEINQKLSATGKRDYELVLSAKAGDQKAYALLLGYYQIMVHALVIKMVRNSDDAKDVSMEAFAKAFQRLDQYQPVSAFSTWLFRIASNQCIDFLKKKKTVTISLTVLGEVDEEKSVLNSMASDFLTPEELIIKKQDASLLKRAVNALTSDYKQVIELHYLQEYSCNEIAQMLNIPLGTIKVRVMRAKELLLQVLKQYKKTGL